MDLLKIIMNGIEDVEIRQLDKDHTLYDIIYTYGQGEEAYPFRTQVTDTQLAADIEHVLPQYQAKCDSGSWVIWGGNGCGRGMNMRDFIDNITWDQTERIAALNHLTEQSMQDVKDMRVKEFTEVINKIFNVTEKV